MAEGTNIAKEAHSKVEDELTCSVCLDPYTHPRLLSCFHIYCQHCLEQMVVCDQQRQPFVSCPKCQSPTVLPPSGVSGLQAAFHIQHLFDIQETLKKIKEHQMLVCEKCFKATRQATSYCRHCSEFICDFCTTVHIEWKQFSDHEVISLDNVKEDLIQDVSPKAIAHRCIIHNKRFKFYCETCGKVICSHCTVHAHKDHKYCVITDTFESHKKEISALLEPMEKQLEAIEATLVKLEYKCKEIAAKRITSENAIHTAFNEIRKTLDAREAELVTQLDDHIEQQLSKLSTQREDVENLQAKCKGCLHFVRESLRRGSPGEVLSAKTDTLKLTRELVNKFDPHTLEIEDESNVGFIHSAQFVKKCQQFGHLCQIDLPHICEVGENSTGKLRFLSQVDLLALKTQLVSSLTDRVTECVTTKLKGDFKIYFRPQVGGAHWLKLQGDKEELVGSSFPVSVKTPVNKIGTAFKIINGVKLPFGIAISRSLEVILVEEGAGCLSIFSATGEKLRTIDTVVGGMKDLRGVAVDCEDNILVADAGNHRLLKLSRDGNVIAKVGSKGFEPGQFKWPIGVCVNRVNGMVYVADYNADCVHIFNSDLTFSSKFGSTGTGDGQFSYPYDVDSDSFGCVYVADGGNHRVQLFTPDGDYLRQFGKEGGGYGELKRPDCIGVGGDDLVYVGESGNDRVSVFTADGGFCKCFGSTGCGLGQFAGPRGMAVAGGAVYISDNGNNRVQLF